MRFARVSSHLFTALSLFFFFASLQLSEWPLFLFLYTMLRFRVYVCMRFLCCENFVFQQFKSAHVWIVAGVVVIDFIYTDFIRFVVSLVFFLRCAR